MFRRNEKLVPQVDTLIGREARIEGDVEFAGGLHLDGRVTGSVRAHGGPDATLSVGEQGCIEGSVEVPNVILNGAVRGDIHAGGRLVLGARARVLGNVHYGIIEIALGAEISGTLVRVEAQSAPAPEEPADAQSP